jgi:hypothetical protein
MRRVKTISDLVSSAPRAPEIAESEAKLTELREQLNGLALEESAAASWDGGVTWTSTAAREQGRLRRAIRERKREIETALTAERKRLSGMRAERAAAIARVLSTRRATALSGIERAYNNLIEDWRDLDAIDDAVADAGGARPKRVSAVQVNSLIRGFVAGVIGKTDVNRRAA